LLFRALRRTVGAKGVVTDGLLFRGTKFVEFTTRAGGEYGRISEDVVDDRGVGIGNDAHATYLLFWYSCGSS
jgi:hypothetical protein